MQAKVLSATLHCMGAKGYQHMSLQDIADEAGVSRGAITHHYPSKFELVLDAVRSYLQARADHVEDLFSNTREMSLDRRLDVLWDDLGREFAVSSEIFSALKSDDELLRRVRRGGDLDMMKAVLPYAAFFPEMARLGNGASIMTMILAFYRGLMVESIAWPEAALTEMRMIFKGMVHDLLDGSAHELPSGAPGKYANDSLPLADEGRFSA
ncbi:TetR/AcrR family transcriptional regulator [Hyphomonas sp. WL0036]|uniref:TetR/AcrR family transcriptional regulator n=1 Tax=Hyphomonas sediminis TaxID=2866160 RepID=UPI001C7EE173|nr:TetR/AcrR family transcriptional regulator [Hyphomonas sediminis]MBY9068291.1 TetR/AcrR family transcriptional regulator [Hyphomonas sediminis]